MQFKGYGLGGMGGMARIITQAKFSPRLIFEVVLGLSVMSFVPGLYFRRIILLAIAQPLFSGAPRARAHFLKHQR